MDFSASLNSSLPGGLSLGGIGGGARRSFVSRYFALMLDQANTYKCAGFVKSVEGGAVKAEIVKQEAGGSAIRGKSIGLPNYEPFTAQIGMAMTQDFYSWIAKSWAGEVQRMNGAFLAMDYNRKVVYEHWFREALITETTFPTLDAASKDAAYMTIKFAPEKSGHSMSPKQSSVKADFNNAQKAFTPNHFRFELGDLPCKKVSKIDSFTIKQGTKRLEIGGERDYQLEPTNLEVPNLVVYTSLADAAKWFAWHEDFVINGNNSMDMEKEGSITMLGPKDKELVRINLSRVGIHSISVDKGDAATDSIKKVKIELYVEEMAFKYVNASGPTLSISINL